MNRWLRASCLINKKGSNNTSGDFGDGTRSIGNSVSGWWKWNLRVTQQSTGSGTGFHSTQSVIPFFFLHSSFLQANHHSKAKNIYCSGCNFSKLTVSFVVFFFYSELSNITHQPSSVNGTSLHDLVTETTTCYHVIKFCHKDTWANFVCWRRLHNVVKRFWSFEFKIFYHTYEYQRSRMNIFTLLFPVT